MASNVTVAGVTVFVSAAETTRMVSAVLVFVLLLLLPIVVPTRVAMMLTEPRSTTVMLSPPA